MGSRIKKILMVIVFAAVLITIEIPGNHAAYAQEHRLIRVLEKDTTGDGVKERVNILADEVNKGYVVEIIHGEDKIYRLRPAEKFKFIAGYTPFYDLNMIIADINKDRVPEIIAWGSGTHEVPFHVFRWDNSNYKLELSGWTYSNLGLEDITRDGTLEIVIENRLYGLGHESIYYGWQDGRYKKVYYRMDAARGFDKIKFLLQMMNGKPDGSPLLYNEDIPDRTKYLKKYFTDEWINNKENIKSLAEFNKNLLFIEISQFLVVDKIDNNDPSLMKKTGKELWRFKVRVFNNDNSRVITRELIMEVVTVFINAPADTPMKDRWRIDSIEFKDC